MFRGGDFGVSHKRDKAPLKGAEATFDLALGLRCWGHQMSHPKGEQGALELAFRIAVVGAGT